MYKDAQKNLQKEFPESISNKFEFLTFAIDTSKDAQGSVLPGVGGMIYPKLGLGDIYEKIDIYPILSRNEWRYNRTGATYKNYLRRSDDSQTTYHRKPTLS